MVLQKIQYQNLSPKQQEIYNFQKIASVLADYGFNCIKLSDDWQGADFLAYHVNGMDTLKVQLKSRVHVAKKYQNKNLFLAFPIGGDWYLVEHDELLNLVSNNTIWLNSVAWNKTGAYSSGSINRQLKEALQQYALTCHRQCKNDPLTAM
ncbi:MAG: hypothetical protein WC782_07265 [Methylococcaceae bacterium]|jgi:hypothetical protein